MAFVKCDKCGEDVSTKAAFCTACAHPMVREKVEAVPDPEQVDTASSPQSSLHGDLT